METMLCILELSLSTGFSYLLLGSYLYVMWPLWIMSLATPLSNAEDRLGGVILGALR